MKILSITIHHVVNFGSVLQAYATQKLFEDKGADFVTLNYIPERLTFSYRFNEVLIKGKSPLYKRLATYLTMEVLNKKVFTDFLKKYVRLTAPFYLKDKGKKAINADIFIFHVQQNHNLIPVFYKKISLIEVIVKSEIAKFFLYAIFRAYLFFWSYMFHRRV